MSSDNSSHQHPSSSGPTEKRIRTRRDDSRKSKPNPSESSSGCPSSGSGTGQRNPTVSVEPRRKVCFICGSQTMDILNIHEPRIGPNIIEIINEKFNMQPLNDDKFLCYSCNNWLINWHSLQQQNPDHKTDEKDRTDGSSSSRNYEQLNDHDIGDCDAMRITVNRRVRNWIQDENRSVNGKEMDECERRKEIERTKVEIRQRLKKYLYKNRKRSHAPTDDDDTDDEVTRIMKRSCMTHRQIAVKCNLCGVPFGGSTIKRSQMITNYGRLNLCHRCTIALKRYTIDDHEKLDRLYRLLAIRNQFETITIESPVSIDNNRTPVRPVTICPTIVDRLRRLGTTIQTESDQAMSDDFFTGPIVHRSTPIEPITVRSTNGCDVIDNVWSTLITPPPSPLRSVSKSETIICSNDQRSDRTDKSNEIILSFDTVLTEVLPITSDLLKRSKAGDLESDYPQPNDRKSNKRSSLIDDIYKRVPKCITISLL